MLPELVHLWVHRVRAPTGAASGADPLRLHVSGMGCTACTAKVQSTVEAVDGVARCEVRLEDGSARVHLSPQNGDSLAVQRACEEALQAAGFAAEPAAARPEQS